jgi:hypothetical protein
MDWVRGLWMSQDQRSEEHTKASYSAMAVMDLLSQNRNLKEQWSGSSSGNVQSYVAVCSCSGWDRNVGDRNHDMGGRYGDVCGRDSDVGGHNSDVSGWDTDVGGRDHNMSIGLENWSRET